MTLGEIWQFVVDKPAAAGVVLTAGLAAIGGVWAFYRHFSKKKESPANTGQSIRDGNRNILVGPTSGTVSITAGAEFDIDKMVGRLAEEARKHGAATSKLEGAVQHEQDLQDQVRQLTAAVEALKAAGRESEAPPGVDVALRHLQEGDTGAAEEILQAVKERRKTEGTRAHKEAAAAARHIGALAYLHDTRKALAAYLEAVDLDPDNADGWNWLGIVLYRTGDLDGAMRAFDRVLSLGNISADQGVIATATGNLGLIHQARGELDRAEVMLKKSLERNEALGRKEGMAIQYANLGLIRLTRGELDRAEVMLTKSLEIDEALGRKEGMASAYSNLGALYERRGDIDRAEEMLKKSLELHEAIGRKEGMASNYGNLGLIHQRRGELDRAEVMHKKSLEIEEALGRKEGMANQYGNLGVLYKQRGDLDRAEETYRKALALFTEIGAKPRIEHVEQLLADLQESE